MMKWNTGSYLICIFLCVPFLIKGQVDTIFAEGDSLYANGEYRLSSIAYERVVYKINDHQIKSEAYLRKAYALKKLGQYEAAQKNLDRVNLAGLNDSLAFLLRYESALNAYLAGKFSDGLSQMVQMDHYLADSQLLAQKMYLHILILNELQSWIEASEMCRRYLKLAGSKIDIDTLYEFAADPGLKKIKKAQYLSTFMPGTGQIYAGRPGKGVLNVLLQLSSFGFAIISGYNGYYVTGFLLGFGFLQSFYFGGIRQAEHFAEQYNRSLIKSYNDRLKNVIVHVELERISNLE